MVIRTIDFSLVSMALFCLSSAIELTVAQPLTKLQASSTAADAIS